MLNRFLDFLKWFAVAFLPFFFLAWVLYRAIWTLSAAAYTGYRPSQNNIKVWTQWGAHGTEFQEEYYGAQTWKDGGPTTPFRDWMRGFRRIWFLPLVLFGWGFWSGLFWGKNDPQNFN